MLNRRNVFLIVAVAFCALVIGTFIGAIRAEDKAAHDFKSVLVVGYPTGMTGFFDTRNGALYVYDSNWDKCVYIRHLKKLGEPMVEVRDPDQE
jgi:hypothetical protein